eukprot:17513-Prymnesium_polylepis.1
MKSSTSSRSFRGASRRADPTARAMKSAVCIAHTRGEEPTTESGGPDESTLPRAAACASPRPSSGASIIRPVGRPSAQASVLPCRQSTTRLDVGGSDSRSEYTTRAKSRGSSASEDTLSDDVAVEMAGPIEDAAAKVTKRRLIVPSSMIAPRSPISQLCAVVHTASDASRTV